MFDCELAAAAAANSRGPYMSHDTVRGYASTMSTYNNMHGYSRFYQFFSNFKIDANTN